MKILHIIPNLKKGGAERLVTDIVRELVKREGIEVRLVLFREEIAYDIDDIRHLVHIIPSSVQLSLWRKNKYHITELQQFLDAFRPDIIHSHLFEAEIVSRSCYYPKAKWFSHFHDNMIQFNNWTWSNLTKPTVTNFYEKRILFKQYERNGGTHFIAISRHSEAYIRSVQTKYPVTLLHNAIDIARFQKPADDIDDSLRLRSPNHLTSGSVEVGRYSMTNSEAIEVEGHTTAKPLLIINLINIGSFTENKNQQFIIDVILILNKMGINVNCYFLGSGKCLELVQNKAFLCGVQNQCHFIGIVEHVQDFFWFSDVYVHVARSEALGLTLIEAMAAGLPVVTLDGGGNRDLIVQGENGYIIEKENPNLFVEKILYLWDNKVEYQRISNYAENFAKKYDIRDYVKSLIDVYKA